MKNGFYMTTETYKDGSYHKKKKPSANTRAKSPYIEISVLCLKECRPLRMVEHVRTIAANIYCQQPDQINEVLCRNCSASVSRKVFVVR